MNQPVADAPPTPLPLLVRLSAMMFLQYAIWGAWLPLFYPFLTEHRGFSGSEAGNLFGIAAIGALVAPFVAGQIADRWASTEKFLGLSHLLGAALVWQLATIESYGGLVVFGLLYSLIYGPTLSLTNSIAFHHLLDRDRDFAKIRVWGTIGWICAGIGMGQWLLHVHTPDAENLVRAAHVAGMADSFRLSAVLGALLGLFCFTLPHTPPQQGKNPFAAMEALGSIKRQPLMTLFLVAFPIACVHQFYFVRTEQLLDHLELRATWISRVFGVGGGPMTIGQIAEILVIAVMPFFAKRFSRKSVLAVGLLAYIARFAIFAYVRDPFVVTCGLALHGLVFGCFFYICFLVIDENTATSVRASAQSLFGLVVFGFGVIAGNLAAGYVDGIAKSEAGLDFAVLFGVPMWTTVGVLVLFLVFYPGRAAANLRS